MKKGKFLIPALAMLMCFSVGAGVSSLSSFDADCVTAAANELGLPELVIGDNTITVTEEAVAEGMVLTVFTVEEAGVYTFISNAFNVSVGDMDGNVIGKGSLELNSGTYFVILGTDTISTAGNYVATIMEGVPAPEPTVHEAGQMYAHNNGVNANENGGGANGFAFYFKTEANEAAYNGDWSFEYGATTADNIKLTRNGVTTSIANVGQGTIVRYSETEHYMKLVPWTVSNALPLQEGDVLTIGGTFKCTKDDTQMFNITETTVTYKNGTIRYSTDPEVHDAGHMLKHDVGIGNNSEAEFAFYFKTNANGAAYKDDWSLEYGATSVDNVKLTRNGVTTSVAVVGQGMIVRLNEIDHYMKFAPWTVSSVLPVQEGDVFTISGAFKCTSDATQMFEIAETTVTYENGTIRYSTDPEVHDAGQMYTHENGVNLNEYEGNGFGFYFRTDANSAKYNSDWSVEYSATSVDNIKLTRNGETTSVAVVGQGTIVKLNETDHYMKFVPWTTAGVLPVQEGDVFTISGAFKCTSDATQMFEIAETTVTYENGALKYSTDTQVPDEPDQPDQPDEPDQPDTPVIDAIEAGQMYVHNNGGNGDKGVYFTLTENALPYNTDWSVEYKATSVDCIKLTRNGETFNVANVNQGLIVKYGATDYYLKMEGWLNENFPMQEGDVLTISGIFRARDAETDYFAIAETSITYEYGLYQFSTADKVEIIETGYMYAHPYATNSAAGLHFSMNENGSTFNEDWSVEYASVTANSVRLIRGGQTIDVGNMDAGTIVKFSATEYYIKFENWINNNFPLQNGDVILVDGLFKCKASDDIMNISASYIRVEETETGYIFKFLNPSVTFVNNDGTVLGVKVYAYEAGVLAEKPAVDPTATAEGYTCVFLGWYNGETAWNFETDTIASAVVLQAKYEMVAIEYKASFVADGETVDEITFTIENMGAIALPTVPEKEGYTGKWDKTIADITLADIIFTAVYEEVEEPSEPPMEDDSSVVTPPVEDDSSSSDNSEESSSSSSSVTDSKGCKSAIGGIAGGGVALGFAAVALLKKKEEDEE